MLRKIRIVAATICFTLITLLFLDFTGTLHLWFGWLAKIQFLPAVLALNVGVVAFLVILTLLFGRFPRLYHFTYIIHTYQFLEKRAKEMIS